MGVSRAKRARSRGPLWALVALLAAGLFQAAVAGATPTRALSNPEADGGPRLRIRATQQWYGDGTGRGAFSASYRRFLARAAAREAQRYPTLLSPAAETPAATSTRTWVNLGPTKATFETNGVTLHVTDSGRVRSIIVDGSTIYVASAGGGVWKSTDSGSTWAPITDDLSSLSDGSLAMDPTNHSTLYLGFGDPFDGTGIGLVKTTDGGAHWSAPVFLGNSTIIPQVLVDPSNSNIVLAATNDGLYRSTDAGATFSQVSIDTGHPAVAAMVWSIVSTGPQSFALSLEGDPTATSGTTDGQVWTSADDGATWTQATGMTKASGVGRITLASAPSHAQTVYALAAIPNDFNTSDLADIFKSTDGGQTWTALNVNATNKAYTNPNGESTYVGDLLNGQGWYDQLVAVDPSDPNTVYFGGALLLAKTTDGGSTFTQKSNWLAQYGLPYVHADFHTAAFDASGNLYVGTDGGIFKSSDGGSTFTDSLNVGLVDQLPYSVGSSTAAPDAVIGGLQDLGTRLREGSTSIFDQVIGGDGFGSDINRSNPQLMLGSIYYDQIEKSANGGSSWSTATSGISGVDNPSSAPFFTKIVEWQGTGSTGNELYTFTNFKIYRSTNYAGSWSALPTAVTNTGAIRNIGVAPGNSDDVGAVASGGRIFLSSDGGSTWGQAAAPPNNQLSLSYISFDPNDPNTVYVASVAPVQNATHLWKSTDFGATWTQIDGSGGTTNGFPTGVPVNIVTVDPQDSSTVYAGTQLGLYQSTDGGSTWSRFGAGLPLVSIDDLYISPDDSLIRAASYGRGFWQLAAANDFTISAAPATVSVGQGAAAPSTISTAVLSGTAEDVALSASGLPAGATASFEPTTVTAGGSSTLTLTAGAGTAPGSYDVTVTGTSASATHTTQVTFDVLAPTTLSVSRSGAGSGTVGSSPAGISCGATCSHDFPYGTPVDLTATPATGSVFTGWSGACSGTGTCSVTMSQNRSVTATFALAPETLSVSKSGAGSGTVGSSPAGISCGSACAHAFDYGTQVTLTATPAASSTFGGWSGACSGTGTCQVTMGQARSVTATFVLRTETLSVSTSGTGTGAVSSSPAGVACGPTCSHGFAFGTQVTLSAAADAGSTFTGWSGACSGAGICQVTMDQARDVTAAFTKQVSPQCIVPKLKGKKLAAAKRAITHAHCAVGKITRAPSKRVAKGRVISQRPAPGKHLHAGAKVKLVVSRGKK